MFLYDNKGDFVDVYKLEPKIDESNSENIYNRNKVRNEMIPYIKKEFNQNIIKTIDGGV